MLGQDETLVYDFDPLYGNWYALRIKITVGLISYCYYYSYVCPPTCIL